MIGDLRRVSSNQATAGRSRLRTTRDGFPRTALPGTRGGLRHDGESGFEGCRAGRVVGTYLHGPLLPRNPWLADWLLAQAIAHRTGEPPIFEPLTDTLEDEAHRVAAARARSRGGRGAR
jgi:CobQ-like glutamine amidotransferase family enzyme